MSEARDEVCEEAEAVCSVRMVLLWAMQALERRVVLARGQEGHWRWWIEG